LAWFPFVVEATDLLSYWTTYGRAVPYGVYDHQHNCGTIHVGQSADTPAFAVDNLVRWCESNLSVGFPGATALSSIGLGRLVPFCHDLSSSIASRIKGADAFLGATRRALSTKRLRPTRGNSTST
jgi:hypothetical protein